MPTARWVLPTPTFPVSKSPFPSVVTGIAGDETARDHMCGGQRWIGLPVAVEWTVEALQAAVFISFWDRGPFEQPGCLLLQAAFTGLGIALAIRLDNQTQAGVFTDRTNFAHGDYAQKYSTEDPFARAEGCGRTAFCGKKARNDLNCRFEPWVVGLQERFFDAKTGNTSKL